MSDTKLSITFTYLDSKKNSHERTLVVDSLPDANEKIDRLKAICKRMGYVFIWSMIETLDTEFNRDK